MLISDETKRRCRDACNATMYNLMDENRVTFTFTLPWFYSDPELSDIYDKLRKIQNELYVYKYIDTEE